jgi:hypothetical protein
MSSSTVIEEITVACPKQSAVAYFYFDFRNNRQRMDIMLRSIVWQLSGQLPSPYSTLHQLYAKLKNGTIQPQCIHLQGVLKDLLAELDQTYIVIDGLDECNETDWKPIIEFIHSLGHPTRNAPHPCLLVNLLRNFEQHSKMQPLLSLVLGSQMMTLDPLLAVKFPRSEIGLVMPIM